MPYSKTHKPEKIPVTSLIGEALGVLDEMLMLITERTHCDNNNMGKWFYFEFTKQNSYIQGLI